jgi:hypothetical protein
VLVVLQGMDTSGKGGAVKKVAGLVNPAGARVTGFGPPTEEERAQDFLWRIEKALPPPGVIGFFDRSHYEDVLIVRVHDLVPPAGVGDAVRPDQRLGGRARGAGRRAAQGDAAHLAAGAARAAAGPPGRPVQALEGQPR